MRISITTILISTALTALPAVAQTQVSMQQCRELAVENNKLIEATKWQIKRAEAETKRYHSNYFPTLDFNATGALTTLGGDFTTPDLKLPVFLGAEISQPVGFAFVPSQTIDYNIHSLWNVGLTLTQPIYMGGKISTAYRIAQLSTDLATINGEKTAEDVSLQSDEAYLLLVKCRQLGRVAKAYTGLIENVSRNVDAAYKVGMKTKNDVMRVNVAMGECQLAEAQAENGCRLAAMNLCHITGMPLLTELEPTDTIAPSIRYSDISNDYTISDRPEYKMLEIQSNITSRKIKLAKAEQLPEVGVKINYSLTHGGSIMDETVFDKKLGLSGLLSVKIPIFNWGRNSAIINSAKAEYEENEARRQDLVEKMELEIMKCRNQLEEAILETSIAERNLQQATENLRVSEKTFLAGTTTLSDHLEANLLWLKASQRLIEANNSTYLAYLRYNRACGKTTH